MIRPLIIAALALTGLLLTGCGIAFGGAPEGNDFFTSLRVSGRQTAGSPLTAAVSYETIYPAPVDILCELRQDKRTLAEIGRGQAPAIANRDPDDDGVVGNFSIDFVVDEPGTFKVECYTPADEANFIIEEFEITPAD